LAGDEDELTLDVEPVWRLDRGQPYVGALRAGLLHQGLPLHVQTEVPVSYLADRARELVRKLVEEKLVVTSADCRYLVAAYPANKKSHSSEDEEDGEELWTKPVITPAAIAPLHRSSLLLGPVHEDDTPVFLPQEVVDEFTEQTRQAGSSETASILIGHLHRDGAVLFAETTAMIPVRDDQATTMRVGFSAQTWQAVAAGLTLRRRHEQILGWAHSHPSRYWCRADCAPEARRACALHVPFFSADDCLVHRVVFHQPFCVALVATHAIDEMKLNLFGWRRGMIAERGFHVLHARADQPIATAAATIGDKANEKSC
jgi:proteasome lid subunit RPN8/RPN11